MSLDVQCTSCDFKWDINNCDDDTNFTSTIQNPEVTNEIPPHTTTGTHIYRLQKQIEEVVGQCRTLAFLNNDIPTLEAALEHGKSIATQLREAATIPGGENCPPTFKALAAAGVKDFRKSGKIIHRAGAKRKFCNTKGEGTVAKKKKLNTCSNVDVLQEAKRKEAGRPKLKRAQRRRPVLLRQVSSATKQRAALIIQRGMIPNKINITILHYNTYKM